MELILKLIIFMPLLAGITNGIFCKKISNKHASIIGCSAIIIAAISAYIIFNKAGVNKETMHIILGTWIKINSNRIHWALYVDQLTAIMFILITTVSAVVHVYSLGYMADDKNLPKFLSYLSLFTFFMLSLVSADNFLQLFFGWEGVGLCSYLLIGYYYQKDSANNAAIKAFVVNRVGDFAFIIGVIMIILYAGSVDFDYVFSLSENLSQLPINILGTEFMTLDIICLMLFLGCMGKSAQIGMHVWLPDAMEGPTPVSALIHAATMVTAGVFLVARCSFMFEYSPKVLDIIAIVGAVTCLFAALVAITQSDIKKIIAYSTCSQLGYMFFACGVSAYQVGIFHLITHGFFKALLFLSAGSVIHAVHEQDIFKMGNLYKKMPITYANFWIGSLAIIGIFPFAGFYSKDLVLEAAYVHGGVGSFAFMLGIIAATLTAIYSLKIIILTFHGQTRLTHEQYEHAHESPQIMNIPLFILTAGTLFAGMIGFYILEINNPNGFFAKAIFNLHISTHEHHVGLGIQLLPLIVGISGALFGFYIYTNELYKSISDKMKFAYCVLKNKFFFDELYEKIFVKPSVCLSHLSNNFDKKIIDRFGPKGFGSVTRAFSWCVGQFQTGYIFNYAFYIVFALVSYITFILIKYLQSVGA
ncbi:MAG: NADH-quinone oxidoreductase subunit L [Acinetobacter sp.]|uniref:NADH-quinone oxidoreductase subunit L n=1 Tax=Acinetobacter sp. TaxID=472 RepID=UPI000F918C87|nr:NADH-quinone oxidoreductase subunit L [Acinetobacter sp.]RUP42037.1 MAG: NADH-quinone oxidoreductase subunit L [Acinetobacter sp.]